MYQGFTEVVEVLLMGGANKDAISEDSCTPLYYAILGRHYTIVEILMNMKCDCQHADLDGTTPLHAGVMIGSLETCKRLVAAGADTRSRDKLNRLPVDLAKEFGYVEIMKYLESL